MELCPHLLGQSHLCPTDQTYWAWPRCFSCPISASKQAWRIIRKLKSFGRSPGTCESQSQLPPLPEDANLLLHLPKGALTPQPGAATQTLICAWKRLRELRATNLTRSRSAPCKYSTSA